MVGPRAAQVIAGARLDELLAGRTRIDVAEYERLMGLPRELEDATAAEPGTFRFAGVRDDRRTYAGAWNPSE